MHSRTLKKTYALARALALLALLGVSATTPSAPAAEPHPPAVGERTFVSVIGDLTPETGPYHPVAGRYDYGTAENAFGNNRGDHIHEGHDVFAAPGTPVVAVGDGVVLEAGSDGGRGNYVIMRSPELELTFVYMHLIEPASVGDGDEVKAGQRIGGVGCTGSCWGDHLHFEVHRDRAGYEKAIDPLPLLEKWDEAPSTKN